MKWLLTPVCSHSFAVLWIGVIFVATLMPFEPSEDVPAVFCVLCGDGTIADAILNIGLFLPLGAALRIDGWLPRRGIALGVLVSIGVESAQFFIPGRDPSLSDIVFNTLGTALGVVIGRSTILWSRPNRPLAGTLSISATLGAGSVLALTGVLLGPAFPEDTYYGGWTMHLSHLEWYGGRVLQASVDGLDIPPGVLTNSLQVRQHLIANEAIHVSALAGPRPSALAPLFTLHDGHQREILLLGIDGDDLVYRYRTRAIVARLRGPEIRIRDALRGIAWRDALSIVVRRVHSTYCVRVNATERCGLGFTLGTGWAFFLGSGAGPGRLESVLNPGWLAVLAFPIGLWTRFGRTFVAAAALLLIFLLIVPVICGLMPTPATELVGAVVGFLAGWAGSKPSESC